MNDRYGTTPTRMVTMIPPALAHPPGHLPGSAHTHDKPEIRAWI